MNESLQERIGDMLSTKKRWTFTLESGRGEAYSSGRPTLYGHSTYERSSVLAGREQRVFVELVELVEQWDSWEVARADLDAVRKANKRFRYHIPIDQLVSHLPDDTDY